MKGSTIRNRKKVAVPVDFNISNGTIGGCDIDFVLEFNNELLILVEFKEKGVEIPTGQRLMLERVINAWRDSGKKGVVIRADYTELTKDGFITMTNTVVGKVYLSERNWVDIGEVNTVDYINSIGERLNITKCRF